MRVTVEIPQPIQLGHPDQVEMICHEAGGARVIIDSYGEVKYFGNGGGAPVFAINLDRIAADMREAVRRTLHE